MAKKETQETHNAVDNLNDSLTNVSQKLQNNKRYIAWAVAGVVIVVGGILAYLYGYRQPRIENGNTALGVVDVKLATYIPNDSVPLDTAKIIAEYQGVIENGYDAANLATVKAAGLLFQQGKAQEAYDLLDKYNKTGSEVVDAAVFSLQGDCLVDLEKYDEALVKYADAEKKSNNNAYYTPYFIMKQARVHEAKKDNKAALEALERINNEYPDYAQNYNIEYDIARLMGD